MHIPCTCIRFLPTPTPGLYVAGYPGNLPNKPVEYTVKRRFEPLEVEVTRGWPVVIHRGDRAHRVRNLLDAWVVQGKWWSDEERRVCFRVATDGGIMEIYRSGDEWRLARLED